MARKRPARQPSDFAVAKFPCLSERPLAQSVAESLCEADARIRAGNQEIAADIHAADSTRDKRSNCLIFLRNDPRLEPIRSVPTIRSCCACVGLDDVALASYKR